MHEIPTSLGTPLQVLKGLRIIEASAFVAAPLCGMTLAQFGADVIRIDPPGGGLDYRRWPVTPDETSLFWVGLNKAKRSVVIDFNQPEGRELATALICAPGDDAGMLLTNFPPRGFLSYEDLSARRPDLIQLTLSGDRHGASAVDYTINPRLGLPALTGPSDSNQPVNHVLPAWDIGTGYMAAMGIMAAERHRRATGLGQHVKLALEDVALSIIGHLGFIAEAEQGIARERVGNDLYGAFGRDFVCADGERVMIVGLTSKQWRSLCRATAIESAISELAIKMGLDLSQEGNRFRARAEIAALVAPWVAARTLEQVAQAFDQHGVCWSVYQTVQQLVQSDPACSPANPMFAYADQPGVGRSLVAGLPLDFSGMERVAPRPAPALGDQTAEVLSEVLGIDSAEFGRLLARGIVRQGGT